MKNDNNKQLMYQISNTMSEPEAIGFAKTLCTNEEYYIVKVSENPKARHVAKRVRFVVTRYPREKEIVRGCFALFVDRRELQKVGIDSHA